MQNFGLLITALLIVSSLSLKMTPEIESCVKQAEERVSGEENERMKTAVSQLMANVKASNLVAAQKILKENTEADRNMAINKYMVDTCGSMKSCMVCPLDLA